MSIAVKIRDYLHRQGTATADSVAASIPELNNCGGTARALLLLRLNTLFELTEKGKWTTRGRGQSDDEVVREAFLQYFISTGRQGAPLASVIKEVSRTTKLDALKVKQILIEQFVTVNTNIYNRPKR